MIGHYGSECARLLLIQLKVGAGVDGEAGKDSHVAGNDDSSNRLFVVTADDDGVRERWLFGNAQSQAGCERPLDPGPGFRRGIDLEIQLQPFLNLFVRERAKIRHACR